MDGFTIEEGKTGKKLVLNGMWNDALVSVMQKHGIKELECNYAKGWKKTDLSFLGKLPFLEGLIIIAGTIDDVGPINSLKALRFLSLSHSCRGTLDFTCFKELEHCFVQWWPGAKSIFQCLSLERLYLSEFKGKESAPFQGLQNLRRLTIGVGPLREVEHLMHLTKLRHLALYVLGKLESLKGIECLANLEYLDVKGCRRITRIDEVRALPSLKVLDLSDNGTIESLKPLLSVPTIRNLYFSGSTIIKDGDLSVIEQLPNLNYVCFANRKHYSHKRKDFGMIA